MQRNGSIKLIRRIFKVNIYNIRVKNTFQSKMFQYLQEPRTNEQIDNTMENMKHIYITSLLSALDRSESKNSGILVRSELYRNTILALSRRSIKDENLSKNDLVKLLFYIGLQKKAMPSLSLLQETLACVKIYLSDFNVEDSCILANTIFKTAIRSVDPVITEHILQVLHTQFNEIIKDTAVLVCFTKILRQYHIIDYELLDKLALTCETWATNFTTKAHILALFAEARYYNPQVIERLLQSGLEDLQTSKPTNIVSHLDTRSRAKDLSRFLWAISVLGCELTSNHLQDVIWPRLKHRKEFTKNPALLLDSLLSLAILGHYSEELTAVITSTDVQNKFLAQQKNQPWIQLEVFTAALKGERPDLAPDLMYQGPFLPGQTLDHHLQKRPGLKRVFDVVCCLASGLDIAPPSCQFQVPPLHIAGIVVTNKHSKPTVNLELLDETVCLHSTSVPIGVMKLKLRLLACAKHRVVKLDRSHLAKEESEFYMFIEDILLSIANKS